MEDTMNKSNLETSQIMQSPMEETFQKINTGSNRVKLMKAALFEDDDDLMEVEGPPPNVDISKLGQPRQVILGKLFTFDDFCLLFLLIFLYFVYL